ncbi:MAG: ankyrin repeat domain-containing protein [Parachlamydia sp.]|nr:ankyrin repeat domain-containing protein [Parachlamydia sp.]
MNPFKEFDAGIQGTSNYTNYQESKEGTLPHTLHKIALLEQDAFEVQLPGIIHSLNSLFAEFKQDRAQFNDQDLRDIATIEGKLKQAQGTDDQLLMKMATVREKFSKGQQPQTAAKPDLSQTSDDTLYLPSMRQEPEDFWKHLAAVLEKNISTKIVEIADCGRFDRETLQAVINWGIPISPEKLFRFVERLKKFKVPFETYKKDDFTPLHRYVIAGREDKIALLLSEALNASDDRGYTSLEWALSLGHTSIARQLLQAGAKLDAGNNSACCQAVVGGVEVLRLVLDAGASVNQKTKDGLIPLFYAAQCGELEAVKELIQRGADINQVDDQGQTPLDWAAYYGKTEAVKELLSLGADVNDPVNTDWTPLYWAAKNGQIGAIQELLLHGASVNQKTKDGLNPLLSAAQNGELEAIKELIQRGADINQEDYQGMTPLHWAAYNGKAEAVKELIQCGADIDQENNEGVTPLQCAACEGKTEVVRELLSLGADVNKVANQGWTSLYWAAKNGHLEAVQELLLQGANMEQKDPRGWTPLFYAAFHNIQAFRFLLEAGAEHNFMDSSGCTLLQLMKEQRPKHWKLVRQLIKIRSTDTIVSYTKSYLKTTLLSHVFAFKGSSNLQGRILEWQGEHPQIAAHQMAKSMPLFGQQSPDLLDYRTIRLLTQSLHFAADPHNSKQILERIRKGLPTPILTGFYEHAVNVLIWKDLFVICDRGGFLGTPLKIQRFDPNKLDQNAIQMLIDIGSQPEEKYMEAMTTTLPKQLSFTQSENEQLLQELIDIPLQIVGNCGWASTEGMVKAFLLLQRLKDNNFSLAVRQPEELKQSNEITFANWLFFQQMLLLDKYIAPERDHHLIMKSFQSLWSAQKCKPQAFENLTPFLEQLETKYMDIATGNESIIFRAEKAKTVALPKSSDNTWRALGTLSFLFSIFQSKQPISENTFGQAA